MMRYIHAGVPEVSRFEGKLETQKPDATEVASGSVSERIRLAAAPL